MTAATPTTRGVWIETTLRRRKGLAPPAQLRGEAVDLLVRRVDGDAHVLAGSLVLVLALKLPLEHREIVVNGPLERFLDDIRAAGLLALNLGEVLRGIDGACLGHGCASVGASAEGLGNCRRRLGWREVEQHAGRDRLEGGATLTKRQQSPVDHLVLAVHDCRLEEPDEVGLARVLVDEGRALRQKRPPSLKNACEDRIEERVAGSGELGGRVAPQPLLVEGDDAATLPEFARVRRTHFLADVSGHVVQLPVVVTAAVDAAVQVAEPVDEEALHELRREAPLLGVPLLVEDGAR